LQAARNSLDWDRSVLDRTENRIPLLLKMLQEQQSNKLAAVDGETG
jgi:hypothetical protein